MRPLLVGEANPYGADPQYALFPYPENSAGGRLCFKVLGLTRQEYLERFDRVNLCPVAWSSKVAVSRAGLLLDERPPGSPIVLLGAKVTRAFGYGFTPFETWTPGENAFHWRRRTFVCLPHPSGLSRAWNEPRAYERARRALRDAGVLPSAQAV